MKVLLKLSLIAVIAAFAGCSEVASNNQMANSGAEEFKDNSNSKTDETNAENSAALPQENSADDTAKSGNNSPENLVENLYKEHDNENSPFFQDKNRELVDKYFAKIIADKIWKDSVASGEEIGALDFDPLYDAQDTEIADFKIGTPAITGEKATVDVTFTNFGEPQTLKYMLVKENDSWKIEDIDYGESVTLSKVYEANEKPAE